MSDFDAETCLVPAPGLPMLIEPAAPRPSLRRNQTAATFVSQLLAAREKLPSQRQCRRNTVEHALSAYSAGAKVTLVRMPPGYRRMVVA